MPTRSHAPDGSPCWADLWSSDTDAIRRFYGELFGWEGGDADPAFGGYFMFTRDGVPVAGCMGDMGDMPANDTWKVYLATGDVTKTAELAEAAGAQVVAPPSPVADMGVQAVLIDPTGANVGAWEAGTFPGFTVLNEHGTPSWFELHTDAFATAESFYRSVFGWETSVIGDTDEFRYSTMVDPDGGDDLAGLMDARTFLPEGLPSHWSVYWEVDDVDAALARVTALGGSVTDTPEDTPYGRLAGATDCAGASFKLRTTGG
jgi:predicted enzyme related to lactoylglutathione lyase